MSIISKENLEILDMGKIYNENAAAGKLSVCEEIMMTAYVHIKEQKSKEIKFNDFFEEVTEYNGSQPNIENDFFLKGVKEHWEI